MNRAELDALIAERDDALRRLHLQDAECAHMRAERDAARAECDAALDGMRLESAEAARLLLERDMARAECDALRALLKRVLSCGLNEEPHGVGFAPSKQEKRAGELARDIAVALRKGE